MRLRLAVALAGISFLSPGTFSLRDKLGSRKKTVHEPEGLRFFRLRWFQLG